MRNHEQVVEFNQKILGIAPRKVGLQNANEFDLSMHQLQEEITEIIEAYLNQDLVGVIDGLIDLDYFLKGVIYKHGLTPSLYENLFTQVHEANMDKKKGVKKGREGYGDAADAIKPQGWVPPEDRIRKILRTITTIEEAHSVD